MNNNVIANNLLSERKEKHSNLKPYLGKDELIDKIYADFEKFDFDEFQVKLEIEIKNNLKEWWTNPAKGIVKEEVLLAILFEYDITWWRNREAVSYGINKWDDFEISTIGLDLGSKYDFATEFYACPGLTLPYYKCFELLDHDSNLDKRYKEGKYLYLDGFDELCEYVNYCGILKIHEVFKKLNKEKVFAEISTAKEFMFLLGEHDMGQNVLLMIER